MQLAHTFEPPWQPSGPQPEPRTQCRVEGPSGPLRLAEESTTAPDVEPAGAAVGEDWLLLDRPEWPENRHRGVDFVIVGAGGVFVVSSLAGRPRSGRGGHVRERTLADTVAAARAVALMSSVTPVEACRAVVLLEPGTARGGAAQGAILCRADELGEVLRGQPQALDPDQVGASAAEVAEILAPAPAADADAARAYAGAQWVTLDEIESVRAADEGLPRAGAASAAAAPAAAPAVAPAVRPAHGLVDVTVDAGSARRVGPLSVLAALLPLVLLLAVPELYGEVLEAVSGLGRRALASIAELPGATELVGLGDRSVAG